MSNPETDPQETICEADPSASGRVEMLEPREVPLGGIRAINVRRTLPQRKRSLIGAWCFLDHYGPRDVAKSGGMNMPAHPHTGLQTVSWLFSGNIEHRDSAGHHALVKPGELNLMTAGKGISHSERSTVDTEILHGVQLWVALPSRSRKVTKHFEAFVPPVLTGEGWSAQVFLGALLGEESPVVTYSPLLGAEVNLEGNTTLSFTVDPAFEHGILVDSGQVGLSQIRDEDDTKTLRFEGKVKKDWLAYVPPGASSLSIKAGHEGARVLLLGGEPFGEQIVMWWNFVGGTHSDIVQARRDWQAQIAKVGVGDTTPIGGGLGSLGRADAEGQVVNADRYGLPDDEPEPPLPSPPLPNTKLKPRG